MAVAILALQGAFIEHKKKLEALGAECFEIRQASDLERPFDRLVLPGGESTTQAKLLHELGLMGPLRKRIEEGMPVLATCAGLILLAETVDGTGDLDNLNPAAAKNRLQVKGLGTMPITVRRNAYGRQRGSFMATENVATFHADGTPAGVIENFPLVFIRGPFVAETGANARVMCEANGNTVALQQGRILATAFHPEITPDTRIHEFFLII